VAASESERVDRPYDLVVFGATGFTGRLTAEYLAAHGPDGLRWALAGRSKERLEDVRAHLARTDPALDDLDLLVADVTDPATLADVAQQTRGVISTVGPFLEHGEALVAACAEAGTDYLDITGEPEFVDRMYVRHHEAAVASGARLVHACGFDSIPHDLGVLFTVEPLPGGEPHPVLPRPVQTPHPPLYLACTKRDTVTLAAEYGIGALVLGFFLKPNRFIS
jgi:saccharopine dehydrogenase (NAD+, L-glutamate forming)